MTAVQFIRTGLDMSAHEALKLIDDMKDRPLTFPTSNGGNHPLWVLGHMAWTEGLLQQFITGKPNPLADWSGIFGANTEPSANPAVYPGFEEARAAFTKRRAQTLQMLEMMTDADLDGPTKCPSEISTHVGTVGKCFMIMILNVMTHRGQVADARRALGLKRIGL